MRIVALELLLFVRAVASNRCQCDNEETDSACWKICEMWRNATESLHTEFSFSGEYSRCLTAQHLQNYIFGTEKFLNNGGCGYTWDDDALLCWPQAAVNTTVRLACTDSHFITEPSRPDRYLQRTCTTDGWTINSREDARRLIRAVCRDCPNRTTREEISAWFTIIKHTFCVISMLFLLGSIGIYAQLRIRNAHDCTAHYTLHLHLFVVFFLRNVVTIVHYWSSQNHYKTNALVSASLDTSEIIILHEEPNLACIIIAELWKSVYLASYMWLFVEVLYLVNLVYFSYLRPVLRVSAWPYIVLAYSVPASVCLTNIAYRVHWELRECYVWMEVFFGWDVYTFVIRLVLAVNTVFFIAIFAQLCSKLRAERGRRLQRIMRLVRSILILTIMMSMQHVPHAAVTMYSHSVEGQTTQTCYPTWQTLLDEIGAALGDLMSFLAVILYCVLDEDVRQYASRRYKGIRETLSKCTLRSASVNRVEFVNAQMHSTSDERVALCAECCDDIEQLEATASDAVDAMPSTSLTEHVPRRQCVPSLDYTHTPRLCNAQSHPNDFSLCVDATIERAVVHSTASKSQRHSTDIEMSVLLNDDGIHESVSFNQERMNESLEATPWRLTCENDLECVEESHKSITTQCVIDEASDSSQCHCLNSTSLNNVVECDKIKNL